MVVRICTGCTVYRKEPGMAVRICTGCTVYRKEPGMAVRICTEGVRYSSRSRYKTLTMITSKKIFITGQVQGVFFRDSTRQKANALKLKGGVRNLRDGRVEVQVSGEEAVVQLLIKWLEIGPKYAKVSTIKVVDIAMGSLLGTHSDCFEIWPTK